MTYQEQHTALLNDLKGKLCRSDWHGVSDAANDLRVLEAEQVGEDNAIEELAAHLTKVMAYEELVLVIDSLEESNE